jgi:hypothetical protein
MEETKDQSLAVIRKNLKRKNSADHEGEEDYKVEEPEEVPFKDWSSYSDVREKLMLELELPKGEVKEENLDLIDELYSTPHGDCRFSQPCIFAGPQAYRRIQKKIVYVEKPSKTLAITA